MSVDAKSCLATYEGDISSVKCTADETFIGEWNCVFHFDKLQLLKVGVEESPPQKYRTGALPDNCVRHS